MAAPVRTTTKNPNVAFIRPELSRLLPEYYSIRDCIAGEVTVKTAAEKYLPMPNAEDRSPENKLRYKAYLLRAVFYNVCRRTLNGLVGQVFDVDPIIKLPKSLERMSENVTGTGTSLVQLAETSLRHVIAYSRSGLFVDFTNTGNAGASVTDIESGKARPTIYAYGPLEIINWRVEERGSEEILSLVVLLEGFPVTDDGFEIKTLPQFRVLKLNDAGNYVQEIWKDPQASKWDGVTVPRGNFELSETITPTDAQGNPIKKIPFMFIGSQNNDVNPDNPNFYDMASLNLAHYRNSADYEEACYVVGQPTVVASGLTEEWVNKVLKGKLTFGSRGGIPLPTGAKAELLQAEERTMLKEAMDTKEKQMVALGAKLVEQKSVQRTATEASMDNAAETSTLANCAKNVSTAYQWALGYAAELMGTAGEAIEFKLNTDFEVSQLTFDEIVKVIDAWTKGAITWGEMRAQLKRQGTATEDDNKAKAEIAADQVKALEQAAAHDPQFNQEPSPPGA